MIIFNEGITLYSESLNLDLVNEKASLKGIYTLNGVHIGVLYYGVVLLNILSSTCT